MSINIDVQGNTTPLERDVQAAVKRINRTGGIKIRIDEKGVTQPLGNMRRSADEFTKSLEASNARVLAFGASVGIINAVSDAFKGLVTSTMKVEKNLTDINVVMGLTNKQLDKFGGGLFKVAKETGAGFDAASEAATEFARQGLSVNETLKRTKDALILTRLTGMKAADSVKSLTAAMNTFKGEISDSTALVSKFAAVDVKFAVSAEDFAQAIARSGQAARDAGVDINQLIGLVTAAQERTARGGAVIGNSFKTIFTRVQRSSTLNELENIGIAVRDLQGNTMPAIKILESLAKKYDHLNDAQRAYISQNVAGVFQVNILKAALADLGKANNVTAQATQIAASATDESSKKNEQLRQTMSALAGETGVAVQQLAKTMGDIALAPGINKVLDGIKGLADGATSLLGDGESQGSTFAKGLLKGIGNIITGPGLIIFGALFTKLFVNAAKYATSSLSSLLNINKAASARKSVEQSLMQVLTQNAAIQEQMLRTDMSRADKERMILGLIKQQTVEATKLSSITRSMAPGLMRSGVGANLSYSKPGRRAYGFVPNFAEGGDEKQMAREGGYAPGHLKSMNIPGEGGVIYNSSETVKNFPGMSQPAIMPPVSSKAGENYKKVFGATHGFDPYAANGFVPNFSVFTEKWRKANPKSLKGIDEKDLTDFEKTQASKIMSGNELNKVGPANILKTYKAKNQMNRKYGMFVPPEAYSSPVSFYTDSKTKQQLSWPVYGLKKKAGLEDPSLTETMRSVFADSGSAFASKVATMLEGEKKTVSPSGFWRNFESDKAGGASGAYNSAVGAVFETAVNSGLKIAAKDADKGEADFDIRGAAMAKLNKVFNISGAGLQSFQLGDYKSNSSSVTNRKSFYAKIAKQEKFRPKKAFGYIPNFASNPLSDAIEREKGAGVPVSQIRVGSHRRLQNQGNPMGIGVTNTKDEPNGLADVFKAGGFVPNFFDPMSLFMGSQLGEGSGRGSQSLKQKQEKLTKELELRRQTLTPLVKEEKKLSKETAILKRIVDQRKASGKSASYEEKAYKKKQAELNKVTQQTTAARKKVKNMEMATGRTAKAGRGLTKFFGSGLGVGVAASMVAPFISGDDPTNKGRNSLGQGFASMGEGATLGGLVGGPVGAAIGGIIGASAGLVQGFFGAKKAAEELAQANSEAAKKAAQRDGATIASGMSGLINLNQLKNTLSNSGRISDIMQQDSSEFLKRSGLSKDQREKLSSSQSTVGGLLGGGSVVDQLTSLGKIIDGSENLTTVSAGSNKLTKEQRQMIVGNIDKQVNNSKFATLRQEVENKGEAGFGTDVKNMFDYVLSVGDEGELFGNAGTKEKARLRDLRNAESVIGDLKNDANTMNISELREKYSSKISNLNEGGFVRGDINSILGGFHSNNAAESKASANTMVQQVAKPMMTEILKSIQYDSQGKERSLSGFAKKEGDADTMTVGEIISSLDDKEVLSTATSALAKQMNSEADALNKQKEGVIKRVEINKILIQKEHAHALALNKIKHSQEKYAKSLDNITQMLGGEASESLKLMINNQKEQSKINSTRTKMQAGRENTFQSDVFKLIKTNTISSQTFDSAFGLTNNQGKLTMGDEGKAALVKAFGGGEEGEASFEKFLSSAQGSGENANVAAAFSKLNTDQLTSISKEMGGTLNDYAFSSMLDEIIQKKKNGEELDKQTIANMEEMLKLDKELKKNRAEALDIMKSMSAENKFTSQQNQYKLGQVERENKIRQKTRALMRGPGYVGFTDGISDQRESLLDSFKTSSIDNKNSRFNLDSSYTQDISRMNLDMAPALNKIEDLKGKTQPLSQDETKTLAALEQQVTLQMKNLEIRSKKYLQDIKNNKENEESLKAQLALDQQMLDNAINMRRGPDAFQNGMNEAMKKMSDESKDFEYKFGEAIPNAFANSLSSAMTNAISQGHDLKDTLREAALGFLQTMNQMYAQQFARNASLSLFGDGQAKYSGGLVRRNKGGLVPGKVTNGEYRMNPGAVGRYGVGMMDSLNAGHVPKKNSGGEAKKEGSMLGALAGFGITAGLQGLLAPKEEKEHVVRQKDRFETDGAWKRHNMSANYMQSNSRVSEYVEGLREQKRKETADWVKKMEKRAQLGRSITNFVGNMAMTKLGNHLESSGAFAKADIGMGLGKEVSSSDGLFKGIQAPDGGLRLTQDVDLGTGSSYKSGDLIPASVFNDASYNMDNFSVEPGGNHGKLYSAGSSMASWGDKIGKKYGKKKKNSGGPVNGASGIDRIPAMLSEGEYVIRADAARKIGRPTLEKINSGRFNTGGIVASNSSGVPGQESAGAMNNNISITVNVSDSGGTSEEKDKEGGSNKDKMDKMSARIKDQVVTVIKEESRPGGLLDKGGN